MTPDAIAELFRTIGPTGTVAVLAMMGVRWLLPRIETYLVAQAKAYEAIARTMEQISATLRDSQSEIGVIRSDIESTRRDIAGLYGRLGDVPPSRARERGRTEGERHE